VYFSRASLTQVDDARNPHRSLPQARRPAGPQARRFLLGRFSYA
jgi:hypothetical protein